MTSSADLRRRRVAGTRRRSGAAQHAALRALTQPPVPEQRAPKRRIVASKPGDDRPTDEKADQRPRSPRRRRLWWAALATALALAALAAALAYALPARLTDADRAAAVSSARTTLESLLSYRGADFDAHVAQVTPQLTSPFREQFATVATADIKPMAVKNAATVQAKVYEAGVMDTTGDGGDGSTVRVLAFVNQATTTATQKTPAIDQNRVIATMRKVGDRWLVGDLSAF